MKRFVEGADRSQITLFPECLEDWIDDDNPVRVIDVFVDELDLAALGFSGVDPEVTGRPSYHPAARWRFALRQSVPYAASEAIRNFQARSPDADRISWALLP